ncbi:heterokaryon incompatibility protein-domain-containing protein, partial [Immersiella caudata]
AKIWLQTCIESHTTCKASFSSFFPARVLGVSPETLGASYVWLLISDDGERRGEKYVCLSRCWGRKPFLQTKSTNIEAHKNGISMAGLPPNFQDAADITRRPRLRYIWIDSLCIMQDDISDWRKESARISSIYEHAFLVLSATKSKDAYEGMCISGFPTAHKTRTIKTATSTVAQDDGFSNDWALPATGRAWIFQERLLSTRVLHFGPEELTCECLESFDCQCGTLRNGPETAIKRRQNVMAWQSMPPEQLNELWYDLVYRYHQLNLTNQGDIFPAISGLAKHFQRARGSGYVAGLWRGDLPHTLLWYRNRLPIHTYCGGRESEKAGAGRFRDWNGGHVTP